MQRLGRVFSLRKGIAHHRLPKFISRQHHDLGCYLTLFPDGTPDFLYQAVGFPGSRFKNHIATLDIRSHVAQSHFFQNGNEILLGQDIFPSYIDTPQEGYKSDDNAPFFQA